MKIASLAFAALTLMSLNALASIELSESCAKGIQANIDGIRSQTADIIVNSNSAGRVQYAAYLLNISAKYVLNMEMQDSELSDVASICETKFDIKRLVQINRFR